MNQVDNLMIMRERLEENQRQQDRILVQFKMIRERLIEQALNEGWSRDEIERVLNGIEVKAGV